MEYNKISQQQDITQSNELFYDSEPISPLRASIDPRFSSLFVRAAANRERLSEQQKANSTKWVHSPSAITINSNAWSPETSTNNIAKSNVESKKCLTPAWKNRLQGLLFGLLIAAIGIGIIVAVFLTRSSDSSTSTTTTTTAATGCSSLRWNSIGVTVAGNGTYGNAPNQLYYPYSVYVDSNNTIYIADYNNQRVQQWLPNAVNGTTIAGITGTCGLGSGRLCNPYRIYGDGQQNLYIGDSNGIYLWPVGSNGTLIVNTSTFGNINGIFVDKNKNLYASVSVNQSVMMWPPNATTSTLVAGGNAAGYSSSQLNNPNGLAVDSSSNTIYVAVYTLHTIVAWHSGATNGTIVAGRNASLGGGYSSLRNPRDVKLDASGNLYVADTGNNRILLFCQNPPNTTAIPIVETNLNNPHSIALDSDLNLYVADSSNHRVQKFYRIV